MIRRDEYEKMLKLTSEKELTSLEVFNIHHYLLSIDERYNEFPNYETAIYIKKFFNIRDYVYNLYSITYNKVREYSNNIRHGLYCVNFVTELVKDIKNDILLNMREVLDEFIDDNFSGEDDEFVYAILKGCVFNRIDFNFVVDELIERDILDYVASHEEELKRIAGV
jgi:hypothetical protein